MYIRLNQAAVSYNDVWISVCAQIPAAHHYSGARKRRRWGGLRQQWKLLGLFQIDEQHDFYSLTCMMKEGLAAALQHTIENTPTVSSVTKGKPGKGNILPMFMSIRKQTAI